MPMGTREAARRLGVRPNRLHRVVFEGQLARPEKFGNCLVWGDEDLRRACQVLHGCSLEEFDRRRAANHL